MGEKGHLQEAPIHSMSEGPLIRVWMSPKQQSIGRLHPSIHRCIDRVSPSAGLPHPIYSSTRPHTAWVEPGGTRIGGEVVDISGEGRRTSTHSFYGWQAALEGVHKESGLTAEVKMAVAVAPRGQHFSYLLCLCVPAVMRTNSPQKSLRT